MNDKTTAPDTPAALHARIVSVEDVMSDTRILRLELAQRQPFKFRAGQYAHLRLGDWPARPYSIASAPGDDFIEFHIRSAGQGGLSDALTSETRPGSEIIIEGPFGHSYWRGGARPLLALAGGLGVAPVKSILEAHLATAGAAPCHLYWGVRSEEQLYLDRHFRVLGQKHPHFSYIPVLSDAAVDARLRRGFVSDALAEDFSHIGDFDIYLAGPPPMVAATLPALLDLGADKERIFSDAWQSKEATVKEDTAKEGKAP
ncbi:MAG TPA: FAD-binding oxidoreductase [Alphaproteobacteria bacterium]|nr:oxidoreductase [Rhodospirillaceae bacterium]HRJ67445.1 FAD-binding oxidoreductase [Alphaproteobacteria bacterium]